MQDIEIIFEDQHLPGQEPSDDEVRKLVIEFRQLRIGRVTFGEANGESDFLYPNQARLRSLTYSAPLYCEVTKSVIAINNETNEQITIEEDDNEGEPVFLGRIPIMLRSKYCLLEPSLDSDVALNQMGECPVDQGGYFIINGSEKVMLAQERMAGNNVYVFKRGAKEKHSHYAEVRSVAEKSNRMPTSVEVLYNTRGGSVSRGGVIQPVIECRLPNVKADIPIVIVFRALGCTNDKEVMSHICYDFADEALMTLVVPSIQDADVIHTEDVALDFIGKRAITSASSREARIKYAREILQLDFLPHISTEHGHFIKKAYYLGYMVNKLLQVVLERQEPDDRDHFGNKRLDLAGPLLAGLFRQQLLKLMRDVRANASRMMAEGKPVEFASVIKSSIITNGMKYALATGNWLSGAGTPSKTGVSQVLNRLTFAAALSHLRRLNSPIGREGKLAKPRQLHNTHWGMVCPAETPEGQACGLVKNLALMSYVSVGTPTDPVTMFLGDWSVHYLEEIAPGQVAKATKVFVNGAWVGIHYQASGLCQTLRTLRRKGDISFEVSIVMDRRKNELRVYTDAGRICRPLYPVARPGDEEHSDLDKPQLRIRKNHVVRIGDSYYEQEADERKIVPFGFSAMVKNGLIEYLDTDEEETVIIAMRMSDIDREQQQAVYTHCEIHPAMILGVCASIIPFPDHNQSPRNTYQSAMGKQAMGVYVTNYSLRMDTQAHVLFYPQKPLVTTRAMQHLKFRALPSGINACVAIACYSGYNQEDSVIMSQSAIDRGLFRSYYFRSFRDQENRPLAGVQERFEVPQRRDCVGMKPGSYEFLDEDGLICEGTRVSGSCILVGKTQPLETPKEENEGNSAPTMASLAGAKTKKDLSIGAKTTENGVVDKVMLAMNEEGSRFVKVRIRSVRIPQIGDKFSSRHGQKGTVGITYRQEDMPFTSEGIIPDIIVNPHAIPSRMTIGQLIECLLGKVSAIKGTEGDATPFTSVTVEDIAKRLLEAGYQPHGWELMHNGHTGRPLEAQIFLGPTYYQRLKHMVDDKIHSRATGPVTLLTHQPLEGRARGGGLRFGEMERDCLISHGGANFIQERLMDMSDGTRVHVCDFCGLIAVADLRRNVFQCRGCNNKTEVSQIRIPYACKLLFQELMAMSVAPRIMVQKESLGRT